MAFITHTKWIEDQFNGTSVLDLDGVTTINLGIVTDSTISADETTGYSALTPVATGTAWTGPVALASTTCALNGNFDLVFDAADPAVIAQDASGFANARSLVVYVPATGRILAHHTEGSTFGNVAGPLTITFSASGIINMVMS
jgi:hypothetical protein